MLAENALQMLKFDGRKKMDFSQYKERMIAIGVLNDNYHEALHALLPEIDANNNSIDENIKKNKITWTFLVLSLEGPPLMLARQTPNNPHEAWTALINQYEPKDTDAYTRLA